VSNYLTGFAPWPRSLRVGRHPEICAVQAPDTLAQPRRRVCRTIICSPNDWISPTSVGHRPPGSSNRGSVDLRCDDFPKKSYDLIRHACHLERGGSSNQNAERNFGSADRKSGQSFRARPCIPRLANVVLITRGAAPVKSSVPLAVNYIAESRPLCFHFLDRSRLKTLRCSLQNRRLRTGPPLAP
jgi:hypothetical protein